MRSLTMIQRADVPMRPYENQGPTILGATLTVTILAVATTIARLYVRIRMIRNVGWDVSIWSDMAVGQIANGSALLGLHNDHVNGPGTMNYKR